MKQLDLMKQRAIANQQRIVLPEGTELRTLKAADNILGEEVAQLILVGNKDKIISLAAENALNNISKATILDPENYDKYEEYAELLYQLRKDKGLDKETALKLAKDPLYIGCLMIKAGDADGELAGAQNTTGNVLRPALQIIKTKKGINVVSGAMIMVTQYPQYGEEGVLLVADVAVMPNPNAQQLAQIAVCTGETMQALLDCEPRVAMLSFSTKGSAKDDSVTKVVEATKLAQEMRPDMHIDGEMQADAAIVPSVGQSKAPGSKIAGYANTLVFPSLEAGNIGYKLVERLGGAMAIGPILQGIAAPVNDLSRGCSVEDIIQMIIITSNQAIAAKK